MSMSHAVHLIAKNIPGYGPSDGRCLPCSGVSGRAVAVSPCSSRGDHILPSQFKIGSLRCASRGAPFMCKANSSGHRRNPDFSRQNKHGFSRNRNRQNEERESFDNPEESELLSSKNGPLLSLSSSPKFQATAAPGPREKEIVELFRKVQAQLRERAAVKEDKKIEALQGQGKESETVDSLLKLLRKHSTEQVKRKSSNGSSRDINLDQSEQNGPHYEDKSTTFFDSNSRVRDEAQVSNASSLSRPRSNFRRKSPVPQVKYQPIYSNVDGLDSVSHFNSSGNRKKNQVELHPEPEQEPEPEPELEPEPEHEPEPVYEDRVVFDEVSDIESSDLDEDDNDGDGDKQQAIEHEDLSALKLLELRALAKSRGVKGFSKMKKGELMELLSGSSA